MDDKLIPVIDPRSFELALETIERRFDKPIDELSKGLEDIIYVARVPTSTLAAVIRNIRERVQRKYSKIPIEKQAVTEKRMLSLIVDGMAHCFEHNELREMFGRLLDCTLNCEQVKFAHPSFAEIIKYLLPDEARILRQLGTAPEFQVPCCAIMRRVYDKERSMEVAEFIVEHLSLLPVKAGLTNPDSWHLYLSNLQRLGLTRYSTDRYMSGGSAYTELFESELVKSQMAKNEPDDGKLFLDKRIFEATPLGMRFIEICISSEENTASRATTVDD